MPLVFDNWWAADDDGPGLPPTDPPSRVDAAVVGGGYTGLSAALALREAGAATVVFDARYAGWGGSGKNGGIVAGGFQSPMSRVLRRYGPVRARRLWDWSLDALDRLRRVTQAHGLDCDLQLDGCALAAAKPSHLKDLADEIRFMADRFGYRDLVLVGPGELADEMGTARYHGALVDQRSGGLNPYRYVRGLARAAAAAGAAVCENTPVTDLRRRAGRFTLHTPRGRVTADQVLIAGNGYTDRLVPAVRHAVFPVASHIIVTDPLPHDLRRKISPRGRVFFDSKWFLNYFRLTPDGRMLFGGRHNLWPELSMPQAARRLERQMTTVFPELAAFPAQYAWSGRVGLNFDLMPHLGRLGDVYFACGYGGHGVAAAGMLGRDAGRIMAGHNPHQSPLWGLNHPRSALAKHPWLFLPLADWLFKALDRLS